MNNLKRRLSLILSIIMLALAIFPLTNAIASTDSQYVSMSVIFDGKEMKAENTYEVTGGEKIQVSASSKNAPIRFIAYFYDNENDSASQLDANFNNRKKEYSDTLTITVPTGEVGTTKILWIEAVDDKDDGAPNTINKTGWQEYRLKYVKKEEDLINGEVNVKYDGKTLANNSTTLVDPSKTLGISATSPERLYKIYFMWDDGQLMEITESPYNLLIPSDFEPGTTHKLDLVAKYDNGEYSGKKVYYITIPANVTPTNPTDDDLDVLPWEVESKDLDGLAISLRNDSESEKANKNVYALDEKVTYFIDFKNGGKDIKDEVVIKLELPLDFEVIDSANGVVDYDKGTIAWTYPEGMEEEYAGTKTVELKYTAFDRKSTDSKVIYPVVSISKKGKVADDSAVINFIYRDTDTVIEDTHEPYMFGDKNTPTFRPNSTITRAEGALVLTRILLGQDAIDNVTITSVYPDLDQTYIEAQRAIVAATTYGIINGYTDGYYRPNKAMTRAEFMTILARFVEINAEEDGIDGLELKELDELIKIYDDPTDRYGVNGQLIKNHWAIEEVSLLARLNMTSVAEDDDLRMDKGITRAEVAQLVNFFTLRAPAEVTKKTKTQFTDVDDDHDLFADIVEATRAAHDFTLTEDGTEIAE